MSSNCRLWNWFRAEAPEISLVAPDLRGRARSITVAGPSSPAQHAEDMVAVLDELGLDRVTVCGMSMGGFVAVVLATTHPQRVRDVVLVDGGLPMATAEGLTEDGVRAASAAQASRSARTSRRRRGVRRLRPARDAAARPARPAAAGPPGPRPGRRPGAAGPRRPRRRRRRHPAGHVPVAAAGAADPARPRGVERRRGLRPAYTPERVAGFAAQLPALGHTELVPGVDHAASMMTRRGAAVAVAHVRAALRDAAQG